MHQPEELPGVGGERLDIPPLAFRVERVERERRFPGARDPGDDHELSPGDRDADIFEVVLACTFDDDIFHFYVGYRLVPVFKEVRIGERESEGGGESQNAYEGSMWGSLKITE